MIVNVPLMLKSTFEMYRMAVAKHNINIADKETILVKYKTTKNSATGSKKCNKKFPVIIKDMASKKPAAVETALPPLKFAKIG